MLAITELVILGTKMIDTDLAILGNVNHHVAVVGPGGDSTIVACHAAGVPEQLFRECAIDGIRGRRKAGTLAGVVEIACGFVHRKEVVFLNVYGEDGRAVVGWRVKRTTRAVRRGVRQEIIGLTYTGWLDEAFAQAIEGTA